MVKIIEPKMELSPWRSHTWTRPMNQNLIRMYATYTNSALSRTTPLPSNGTEGDIRIDPATGNVCVWLNAFDDNINDPQPAQWWSIPPGLGRQIYVRDENKIYMFSDSGGWELLVDIGAEHRGIEREFAWYAPGLIRPSSVIFHYVAGSEFTVVPNGGTGRGSWAFLTVAAAAALDFPIRHNSAEIGMVHFEGGATTGSVNIYAERVIQPARAETMYMAAHVLDVLSPANTHGAQGLSVTLHGKIRPID